MRIAVLAARDSGCGRLPPKGGRLPPAGEAFPPESRSSPLGGERPPPTSGSPAPIGEEVPRRCGRLPLFHGQLPRRREGPPRWGEPSECWGRRLPNWGGSLPDRGRPSTSRGRRPGETGDSLSCAYREHRRFSEELRRLTETLLWIILAHTEEGRMSTNWRRRSSSWCSLTIERDGGLRVQGLRRPAPSGVFRLPRQGRNRYTCLYKWRCAGWDK